MHWCNFVFVPEIELLVIGDKTSFVRLSHILHTSLYFVLLMLWIICLLGGAYLSVSMTFHAYLIPFFIDDQVCALAVLHNIKTCSSVLCNQESQCKIKRCMQACVSFAPRRHLTTLWVCNPKVLFGKSFMTNSISRLMVVSHKVKKVQGEYDCYVSILLEWMFF